VAVDRDALLQQTDLVALIERDLGPAVRQSGRWWWWRCPFHADGQERSPSFGATPDDGRWKCFGCGAIGNAIDFVMQRQSLSFLEACKMLGGTELPERRGAVGVSRVHTTRKDAPGEPWQDQAMELVSECQQHLWRDEGATALSYLRVRGLMDETIVDWGLGFQPEGKRYESLEDWGFEVPDDGKRHGMWIPRGITFPCYDAQGSQLAYLKFRRSPTEYKRDGMGKYIKLKGSTFGLFGIDLLTGRDVLVVEEGELNAITVYQEAGDLVDVVSVGSASIRAETLWPWRDVLLQAQRILVRWDPDAEKKASDFVRALSQRARRVQVPAESDTNAFHQAGGKVRAWIQFELAKLL